MTKTGFIGLGIMGLPMARNLAKKGPVPEVVGYDVAAERRQLFAEDGGPTVDDPKEIYRTCDLIFLSLPKNELVDSIVSEIIAQCPAGITVVDTGSTSPALIRSLHAKAKAKGLDLLDAPVSGGEGGAISGSLAIMCGGERPVFDRLRPYLQAMGGTVTYMGPSGCGSATKIASNMIVAIHLAALGEAFAFAKKAGLDLQTFFEATKTGFAGSAVMESKAPKLIHGDFSATARIAVHQKDLNNAKDLAEHLGVEIPLSMKVLDYMNELEADGRVNEDHCAVARVYEKSMGLKFGES